MKSKLTLYPIIIFAFFAAALFSADDAHAENNICADVAAGGSYTVNTSCRFGGTIDGADNGGILVPAGKSLTVNAGQTIVWGPGFSIQVVGQIAINSSGAKLQQTRLWLHDEDNDGYAKKDTNSVASRSGSSPGSGWRLRSAMQTYEFWNNAKRDCLDTGSGSQHVFNEDLDDLLEDRDHDRYKRPGSGSNAARRCVGVSEAQSNGKTYYKGVSGNFNFLRSGDKLIGDDLDDDNAGVHAYTEGYYYTQGYYYAQGYYYTQGYYYGQGYYYTQGYYYAQAYYYSQGSYVPSPKTCTRSGYTHKWVAHGSHTNYAYTDEWGYYTGHSGSGISKGCKQYCGSSTASPSCASRSSFSHSGPYTNFHFGGACSGSASVAHHHGNKCSWRPGGVHCGEWGCNSPTTISCSCS